MLTTLIPTKNHGIYLDHLLGNVILHPDSPVTQLLICNDGSTDDTAAILARYAADPRVRIFENKSSIGAMASLMTMYQHVQTPYVSFMSSDDFFYPEQMARLLREVVERDAYFGFGKYNILDGNQVTELQHPGWRARHMDGADDFRALLGFDHYAFLCTSIFRKDQLPRHGAREIPYDLELDGLVSVDGRGEFRGHDWNLAIEMAVAHPGRIHFLNEYCGSFRKVASQMSSDEIYSHTGRSAYEMALLLLRHLSKYPLRRRLKESPAFVTAVQNLFVAKFNQITPQARESSHFHEIYKPVLLAANSLMSNM
ncbi:glycosyltransferase family 2 protein [Herbaspirillum huttiense]|uniref:glycosyltransferase family 2 protein n=1 Tax=Herbaspirillum huttiense TaxID=863372 RepID=UPI002176B4E7|nr:glycosyltransferase [Herbaspirillum huttiense]UWE16086.1 glycosyltransferase [Herbaspirillum huttiense]